MTRTRYQILCLYVLKAASSLIGIAQVARLSSWPSEKLQGDRISLYLADVRVQKGLRT